MTKPPSTQKMTRQIIEDNPYRSSVIESEPARTIADEVSSLGPHQLDPKHIQQTMSVKKFETSVYEQDGNKMNHVQFTDIILPNSSFVEYNAVVEANSLKKQEVFFNSVQTDSKPMTPNNELYEQLN